MQLTWSAAGIAAFVCNNGETKISLTFPSICVFILYICNNKMAQQSLGSTSTTAPDYHVFLQCAQDVEKTFGSHLHRALRDCGYRVFWSKEVSPGVENVKGAIPTASVYLLIFSPKYAASARCLEELDQMFESGASITIPVFFDVKPSDLRYTRSEEGWFARFLRILSWTTRGKNGVYDEAMHTHKRKRTYDSQAHRKKLRYEPGTIEKWRSALSRAANISGLELQAFNGDEGALVDKILQSVVKFMKEAPLAQPAYLVALDKWLDEFERTILQEKQPPGEAKVVGIFGWGGNGKSTLAKAFFNCKWLEYGRSSFLFQVGKDSLIDLQKKLVKDLISWDLKIDNIADGNEKLSRHLRGCKALIVLDNVDNVEQLNALLSPVRAVLHPDSLILVITRNKNILSGLKESSIYEMKRLSAEQSKELFCWHAFHQPRPVAGFEEIVGAFLVDCTGLPLSLKVFGALLRGNDLGYWKHQLCKISNVFPAGIHRWTLLDIACLFLLGEDTNTSIKILEGSMWERSLALLNGEKKCLINQKRLIMQHRSIDYRHSAE